MRQGKAYSIEVRDIEVSFGDLNVLKGISLQMEKGRFYGILGPNGSGKTTLLKSMARALRPQKGAIYVNGEDISRMKARELSKKLHASIKAPVLPVIIRLWMLCLWEDTLI